MYEYEYVLTYLFVFEPSRLVQMSLECMVIACNEMFTLGFGVGRVRGGQSVESRSEHHHAQHLEDASGSRNETSEASPLGTRLSAKN